MAYTATARQTQRTPRENRQYLVCRGGDESSEVIGCQGTLPLVDLSAVSDSTKFFAATTYALAKAVMAYVRPTLPPCCAGRLPSQ